MEKQPISPPTEPERKNERVLTGVAKQAMKDLGLAKSSSGQYTWVYSVRAMELLGLLDDSRHFPGLRRRDGELSITVLAELGRIQDREKMLELAERVSSSGLSTRDAAALIRAERIGLRPPSKNVLTRKLVSAIDEYHLRHVPATQELLQKALNDAADLRGARPLEEDTSSS